MSTFDGIIREFPRVQIDNFRLYENHQPPLACFLSHIHSDHLTGLESLNSPFVYCTAPTRELLLKLERFPHRMNFAKGILETRKQTYRKLKRLLKSIPLETPTTIELTRGYAIQVTLFDANHCTGACMFLLEGDGKAVLYTGDIRSEPWWVNSLVRNPVMIPYAVGHARLDNIYLDTTFAMGDSLKMDFPTKAEGLAELLAKVGQYPKDTVFYIDAWTFGYEDVWVTLSKTLNSRVHLCDYRYRVYSSMKNVPECFSPHSASLLGFQLGNGSHEGCLTRDSSGVRLHSCEVGSHCEILKDPNVIRITPIVTRHNGVEVAELGAGGGQGDLDQVHELEINDVDTVAQLLALCGNQLKDKPELRMEVVGWLKRVIQSGQSTVKLDFDSFWQSLRGETEDEDFLEDIPLYRLVPALAKLVVGKPKSTPGEQTQKKTITFPFSRHSSYNELRCLVEAFKPKDVFPCTVAATSWTLDVSMKKLFGDICSADIFWHDQYMLASMRDAPSKSKQVSSQHFEDTGSESATPSQKRGRTLDHEEGFDISSSEPALSKKLRGIFSSENGETIQEEAMRMTDHEPSAVPASDSSQPAPAVTPRVISAAQPSSHRPQTPASAPSRSATSTSIIESGDRAARRARITRDVQAGSPWMGLRSVRGYHNQEVEEEL